MWVSLLLMIFAICMVVLSGNNTEAEQLYYDVESDVADAEILEEDDASAGETVEAVEDAGGAGSVATPSAQNAPSAGDMAQDIYDSIDM